MINSSNNSTSISYNRNNSSGAFILSKKVEQELVLKMDINVYKEIYSTIGLRLAEQGGMLGSSDGITIDTFIFDVEASTNCASYCPNTNYLNKVLIKWYKNGIQLVGFIHSHPAISKSPSYADYEYAEKIMDTLNLDSFVMPIVITVKDSGKFSIRTTYLERGFNGKVIRHNKVKLDVVSSSHKKP